MSSAVRRSARQLASSVSRATSFAAAPVSVESTSSFGLKSCFFQSPFEGIASALNQQKQRRLTPCARFNDRHVAMSNKCVQLPFIAQRVSYHISELWNLLPSVKTKGVRYARALFLSDRLSILRALGCGFHKGGQKSGCLPACLFSRTSSC